MKGESGAQGTTEEPVQTLDNIERDVPPGAPEQDRAQVLQRLKQGLLHASSSCGPGWLLHPRQSCLSPPPSIFHFVRDTEVVLI